MKKKGEAEVVEKRPVQEIRQEIRSYIRNERDTILKKWMALKESIASEDNRREQFYRKKHIEDTKSLPVNVLKFIGTMKKAVRNTMRHNGGTPYSIIRSMFIYWDADKSGMIDGKELLACMKSLGVKVTKTECDEIVHYYCKCIGKDGLQEMDYNELLEDVQRGEPSVIAFVTQSEDDAKDESEIRFEEVSDAFVSMPPIVKKFLEAVRAFLDNVMRTEGGTPFQHVRTLFTYYDYDYSNGLNVQELVTACRRRMKLTIDEAQAREIVNYYDRKHSGDITYELFLRDVCSDVRPILHFVEVSPRVIEQAKRSLQVNPFISKPFAAPPNKTLETFKSDVRKALVNRVNKQGGSFASWIREAFVCWDRDFTGTVNHWQQLQGAAQRLGVHIDEAQAHTLMNCYDVHHNGQMHYEYLAQEMAREDPHFLATADSDNPAPASQSTKTKPSLSLSSSSATQRTPANVKHCLHKLQRAVNKFVRASQGALEARDVLHGTFLRFDAARTGCVSREVFKSILTELRADVDDVSTSEVVQWFDSTGTDTLDYNMLVRQMYGSQNSTSNNGNNNINSSDLTEPLQLPKLRESTRYSATNNTNNNSANKYKLPAMTKKGGLSACTPLIPGNPAISGTSMSSLMSTGDSVSSLLGTFAHNNERDYMSVSHSMTSLGSMNEFGVTPQTMQRNNEEIESTAMKLARMKQKKNKILQERLKVERKIAAIDEQKKKIIESYKAKKSKSGGNVNGIADLS